MIRRALTAILILLWAAAAAVVGCADTEAEGPTQRSEDTNTGDRDIENDVTVDRGDDSLVITGVLLLGSVYPAGSAEGADDQLRGGFANSSYSTGGNYTLRSARSMVARDR